LKKLITFKNHISQYFPLELFPRTVFPGNYHWEFPANPGTDDFPDMAYNLSTHVSGK
jgi:hypothetical protein